MIVSPAGPLNVEATSFVAWMINCNRGRRDMVGLLANHFARDPNIRTLYLNADLDTLTAYIKSYGGDLSVITEALYPAYNEWKQLYEWYNWTT